jgi:hypothetical protein
MEYRAWLPKSGLRLSAPQQPEQIESRQRESRRSEQWRAESQLRRAKPAA